MFISLGMACYWPLFRKSWVDVLWSGAYASPEALWNQYFAFVLFVALACIVAMAFRAVVERRESACRAAFVGIALATTVSNLSACLAMTPLDHVSFELALNACLNASTFVALTFSWAKTCTFLQGKDILRTAFLSLSLSSAIMLTAALPQPANLLLPIVMPLLSTLLSLSVHATGPAARPVQGLRAGLRSFSFLRWDLVGLLMVFNLAVAVLYGLMPIGGQFSPNDTWAMLRITSIVLPAFVAFLVSRPYRPGVSTNIWVVLTLALIVGLFMLIILTPSAAGFGKALVLSGQGCLTVFLWAVLIITCKDKSLSVVPILGTLYVLLSVVSSCVANALMPSVVHVVPLMYGTYLVAIVAVVTLFLVVLSMLFLSKLVQTGLDGNAAVRDMPEIVAGIAPRSLDADGSNAPDSEAQDAQSSPDDRYLELFSRYGLSPRETEVAVLIARGYSIKKAAETLFISPQTVQTHTKSIYRKLDVHDKQAVIDLVESELSAR